MARAYPVELKARALALLAEGNALSHVARVLAINKTTVIRWRDQAQLAPSVAGATQKREEIGRQLLDLTADSIESLRFLARAVRDEAWFQRQDADAIATLLGVLSDKTVRLLAALRPEPAGSDSDGDLASSPHEPPCVHCGRVAGP